MTFAKCLNEAIKRSGLTAKEVSEATGISQGQISNYRHGSKAPKEIQEKLEIFLGFTTPKPKPYVPNYTLQDAAAELGMSVESLKYALKEDKFKPQIGIAVLHSKEWRYIIFPERLTKYVHGEI